MVKNVDQSFMMTSSNVSFCPQLKDIQFTVREEERNQEMFIFKKLESENLFILIRFVVNNANLI